MPGMLYWMPKTPEMAASDQYFSVPDAGGEDQLVARYRDALARLEDTGYYQRSDAMQSTGWTDHAMAATLGGHFRGDWIHAGYPDAKFADRGGRFWPQVASHTVVQRIRYGTIIAIHKALGRTHLESMVAERHIDRLFAGERENNVDTDGVRPLSTIWVCVAPTGADYFEVDAARGPSVVEFVIGTPRPHVHGAIMPIVEEYETETINVTDE